MAVQINLNNEEFQPEKQRLPDNYLSFVPKTGTAKFDKTQMFEIVIPRTNHVIRLNKGYFQVEMKLNMKFASPAEPDDTIDGNWYIGFNNAACIFDQIQIKNNGRTIYSNTFSQITSRLWGMSKSKEYLDYMYQCFLNYKDIRRNVGFTYIPVSDIDNTDEFREYTFRMRIPIGAIFECFDNCDNFSTTQLIDDIVMSMQLSEPYKYLTLVEVNDDYSVKKVMKFTGTEDPLRITGKTMNTESLSFGATNHYITLKTDTDAYYIEKFKMNIPCHYPTPDEKEAFGQLISGGSVSYPFKSYDIDQCSIELGAGSNKKVVANFASNAPNIYGLMMLFTSDDNRVVFEKPYIKDIECNLNEIIKLANERVHTGATYERDFDMYRDLCNNFGVDTFKHLSRIDDAISHDYSVKDKANTDLWGSYCQWYQIAAGNQLGFSGDYFANLINYKCETLYESASTTPNNSSSAYVICAQLTQRMLLFKDGGLTIVTPFSDEVNMRHVMSGDETNTGVGANAAHGIGGLIPSLISPITSIGKGIGKFFIDNIFRIKSNKNSTYAYSTLGKQGYEDNRAIIEQNLKQNVRDFRDFIDRLKAAKHGLFIRPAHGLGTNGYEGGLSAPINTATGIPRAKDALGDNSANRNIDNEKGLTLDDINLPDTFNHTYQMQVYSKDYKYQLVLDYKFGFNKSKIPLTSYGNEMSMENMNHGLRSWLKDKWGKIKGWVKDKWNKLKGKGKEAVKGVVENVKGIVSQYVNDILTGKISIKDVPSKFKSQVEQMIRDGKFSGTGFDKLGQDAMEWYHKWKSGEVSAKDIPKQTFEMIKDLNVTLNSHNGSSHGLLPRHGFTAPINVHATIPRRNMKTRIALMLEKNPALLSQKELRQMYLYKYMKTHKDESHGISRSVWQKLKYGNFRIPVAPHPTTVHPTGYIPNTVGVATLGKMKTAGTEHGMGAWMAEKLKKYKELKKRLKESQAAKE